MKRVLFAELQMYLFFVGFTFISGAIRRYHGARIPAALHRVQLSAGIRLVDRHARLYVPVPVQRILPGNVQGETRSGKCAAPQPPYTLYCSHHMSHIIILYTPHAAVCRNK